MECKKCWKAETKNRGMERRNKHDKDERIEEEEMRR